MLRADDVIAECRFTAVRSGGKGGQNVNKVSTKVLLQFDILNSACLTEDEKKVLLMNLASKVSDTGILTVSASSGRSQFDNRKIAEGKLIKLLIRGLHIPAERKLSGVPRSEKEKRLRVKRVRSEQKAARSQSWENDLMS